jgi:uncharacterized protein
MERILYKQLLDWKLAKRRKPLLLQGARQVGKTWLINEFGKKEYEDFVYLNFEQSPNLKSIFINELVPEKIIEDIGFVIGKKIKAEKTLICFDEIQVCQEAITSLKYFQEFAPEFHIIAAGSLLGVSLGKTNSFPVGKVNFLTLYPLSFSEYLLAIGEDLLAEKLLTIENLPEILHDKLIRQLKMYFFLGGMPEVVKEYIQNKDIEEARQIQHEILKSYQRDFSKYTAATDTIKITEIWQSIPFQLAKENKKFTYQDVATNARSSSYSQGIEWLRSAGLIHVISQIRTAKLPLSGHVDYSKFKIYLLDTGLLGAMLNLSAEVIIEPNQLFVEYNGAFVENYTCLELIKLIGEQIYYWSSEREAEVDFVFQNENQIVPLEVKSGMNRNTNSLKIYTEKFQPPLVIRASPRNYIQSDTFFNVPLYALMGLKSVYERPKL